MICSRDWLQNKYYKAKLCSKLMSGHSNESDSDDDFMTVPHKNSYKPPSPQPAKHSLLHSEWKDWYPFLDPPLEIRKQFIDNIQRDHNVAFHKQGTKVMLTILRRDKISQKYEYCQTQGIIIAHQWHDMPRTPIKMSEVLPWNVSLIYNVQLLQPLQCSSTQYEHNFDKAEQNSQGFQQCSLDEDQTAITHVKVLWYRVEPFETSFSARRKRQEGHERHARHNPYKLALTTTQTNPYF